MKLIKLIQFKGFMETAFQELVFFGFWIVASSMIVSLGILLLP